MNEAGSSAVPTNQFTFECPTVKRDARLLVCFFKNRKHMKGEDFQDQDCRCAMRAGACAAVRMQKQEYHLNQRLYFSSTADVKKCPTDIAEELAKVMMFPFHGAGLNLTDKNKIDLFGSVVNVPTRAVLTDELAHTEEPKVGRKPRSDKGVSRGVRAEIEEGFANAAIDTSVAINAALGS